MPKEPQTKLSSMPDVKTATQVIGIQDPFGGWVSNPTSTDATPHYAASVEGNEAPLVSTSRKEIAQIAESDGITLFQLERFGHIAPAQAWSVLGDPNAYVNDLPLNADSISTSTDAVAVLKNGRVVQFNASGVLSLAVQLKRDPSAHTPISSPNVDMVVFRDYQATPEEFIVWSWEYSGGADIAIVKASDLSTDAADTFYSSISGMTALTNGVPHKLIVGPDGNLYVTDGPFVRQITLATGNKLSSANAVFGNQLPIGSGWVATALAQYKTYVAILASSKAANAARGRTRLFLWDGTATTNAGVTTVAAQFIFDIPDNFGNGLIFDGNTLWVFTNGRNNSSKIWEFTGKGFKKAFETLFISPSTNSIQGSVDIFQDGLILAATKGNANAHLFRFYGSGFHDEGYLCDADTGTGNMATAVGMIRNLYQGFIFAGVNYSSTYKIFISNPNLYQTSTGAGPTIDLRTPIFTTGILGRRAYPLGFKMTVSRIKLYLSQWGSGASLLLSLFNGYAAFQPAGTNDLLNRTIDTTTYPTGTQEIDLSDLAITDLSSFYMNIRWTHTSQTATVPFIRRMEIHIEPSQ